ncbi:MAG TPA: 16S rRNA (cytidine(1402)-2'-O)-methyltransferase [Burkholderiales bacterium]|nr:16S rRNA (cytidine(1402)-2'-O)-methyltransferase [Burkholderiales bacterium]
MHSEGAKVHGESAGAVEAALYVVATPIGNLGDITLRALDTLKSVDVIAAEDTRVSRKLLGHFGIQAELLPAHEHNERDSARKLVALLASGKSVAFVSDAGTPAVSDPGAILVEEARAAGFRVVPIPGASAVMAALAASGLSAVPFCFHGFLPARKPDRVKLLSGLKDRPEFQIFFEAPHRILESIESILAAMGGERRVAIARELTKLFEQVHVCRLDEAGPWLLADENRQRGEFVLLVEGCVQREAAAESGSRRTLEILLNELPLKQAVGLAAAITGEKKNALYAAALEMKKQMDDS